MCVRVCDKYGVQAIYITMQVWTFMHSMCFVKTVRNKNPKSLQVVQASLCACVHVCVCVCVCVCVRAHRCVHSCTCTLCDKSVRNKNPKSLQVVQAQSVCVCVCVHAL